MKWDNFSGFWDKRLKVELKKELVLVELKPCRWIVDPNVCRQGLAPVLHFLSAQLQPLPLPLPLCSLTVAPLKLYPSEVHYV